MTFFKYKFMMLKSAISILLLLTSLTALSQQNLYSSLSIPNHLKNNANAVIRLSSVDIELKSSDDMLTTKKRIITILNKQGNRNIDAFVGYDNTTKIKELEVLVYDDFGKEIKKIKKNDFKDVSAVAGGTLYSDSRVKYLDYTPISYPYTIEFTSVVNSSNTAFIQSFMPLDDYHVSVETSSYNIIYPENITIRKKEKQLKDLKLEKKEQQGKLFYKVENLEAIKPESYSPLFRNMVPRVLVALNEFSLEGVPSKVKNWNDFGKWMYHDLIKDTNDLSESTISMIQNLVKDESSDIEKAKKIYQYVQDKTRYISVQVGIGGWKPFNASEVDKLGYGDCKALTNYTMSLLNAAGVKSNYCVVYGGNDIISLEKDFASMQGNHVFLNVPNGEEDIWLECTSQKVPFGFIADFTDDRDVLVVTPEGGTIKHTKKYNSDESLQTINGYCSIGEKGSLVAKTVIKSKGIQYSDKLRLDSENARDLNAHYKERWDYINSISINNMHLENDKNKVEITEVISFSANTFAKVIGNRMIFAVNTLNRITSIPDRYRNRNASLKIERGFKDVDEVEIKLPPDYIVEALPKVNLIETKFGSYKTKIEVKDKNTLLYKREFTINDGEFSKEDYNKFRDFYKEVSKGDNAKVALIKK